MLCDFVAFALQASFIVAHNNLLVSCLSLKAYSSPATPPPLLSPSNPPNLQPCLPPSNPYCNPALAITAARDYNVNRYERDK